MSTDLFERYAQLDPARESEALPDWASAAPVLLATIDERTGSMQTQQTKPATPPAVKKRRGWLAGVAAFAAVLIAAAVTVGVLQISEDDTGIPVAGIEGDPAAAEAFQAVEATYAAFHAGDGEAWIAPVEAGRTYDSPETYDLQHEAMLAHYAAVRAVDERIEVTQCVSHGFGDWPGVAIGSGTVTGDPVSTGYRFTCDAIHTNTFHDLGGIALAYDYEWVVADGEIISGADIFKEASNYNEARDFTDDFSVWLSRNHEDVFWDVFIGVGVHPYPHPEDAPTVLEYATLFVEESPDWPQPTSP